MLDDVVSPTFCGSCGDSSYSDVKKLLRSKDCLLKSDGSSLYSGNRLNFEVYLSVKICPGLSFMPTYHWYFCDAHLCHIQVLHIL